MLRALQEKELPAASLARPKADDSDRTRALKEVMQSVSKYASSGMGSSSNDSAQAAGQLMMKAPEEEEDVAVEARKERDPCEFGLLSFEQERRIKSTVARDDECVELSGSLGFEVSELLRESGRRVTGLGTRLSSHGAIPPPHVHIETSIPDGITLVDRGEGEDASGTGPLQRARMERAAWAWIEETCAPRMEENSENSKRMLKDLDKLSRNIDKAPSTTEALRRHFDPHHRYHPCLVRLTDHSLKDEGLWNSAIKEAMFPTQPPETPTAGKTRAFAPKALSRTLRGGQAKVGSSSSKKISWDTPNRGKAATKGMSRDRSAPALR